MTEVPPSRWKVVERGRRLEVIDTFADGERPARRGTAARPGLPKRLRYDGTLGWTTHPFYDERGPRAVVLDTVAAKRAKLAGGLVVAVAAIAIALGGLTAAVILVMAAVFVGSNREQVRPWLTRRLDAIAAP